MASLPYNNASHISFRVILGICVAVGIAFLPVSLNLGLVAESIFLILLALTGTALLFRRDPLLFYCRYLNPLVAGTIFVVCAHGSMSYGYNEFRSFWYSEPAARVVLALGLAGGIGVFLLGRILVLMITARDQSEED